MALRHFLSEQNRFFKTGIMAGFDGGLVDLGRHDLLTSTMHTPAEKMRQHYEMVAMHGIRTIRDVLPPTHRIQDRMEMARDAGLQAIWDLTHYHRIDHPEEHAMAVVRAAEAIDLGELWICPLNEPDMHPIMSAQDFDEAVTASRKMVSVIMSNFSETRILTSNATPSVQWDDPFAEDADVIGVNVYPHTITDRICDILIDAHRRYGKPVIISETSWHDGWHDPSSTVHNKPSWMNYVLSEIEIARANGADVIGLCWYPIIHSPPWGDPAGTRWSHGLIREDLSVDPSLSVALLKLTDTQGDWA